MAPKILLAAVALLSSVGVAAHHSVAGAFDSGKRTTVTGTVSKVDWINPHTYLYLDVPDERGGVTTWRFESLPTAMMRKAGLSSALLRGNGGKVTAEAILARDGTPNLGYLIKLTYEDGHFYQLANE